MSTSYEVILVGLKTNFSFGTALLGYCNLYILNLGRKKAVRDKTLSDAQISKVHSTGKAVGKQTHHMYW